MVHHPPKHDCSIEHLLQDVGLRKTKDRLTLLHLFEEGRTWSVPQLCEELSQTDMSTIYRNIQLFVEHNLITQVHIHEQQPHYEQVGRDHHDHLFCTSCNILECIPCPIPKVASHHLELTGTCSLC